MCEPCVSIAESRNIDVLEMDAASRTGIEDIRELIEGARYASVAARYKVYIIDEVHMLSKAAFNGLLKTLEEPPPHVVFIFATTEIRKVPVTVVSRCQRFDLRRIEAEVLMAHLARVAAEEGAQVEKGALALIARAAEGSVRDALSLLDQALSFGGTVSEAQVHAMLGLIDRGRLFDLFEAAMSGKTAQALSAFATQYDGGADPLVVMQDLLGLVHWVTRLKLVPEAAQDPTASETEISRGRALADVLPINVLTRAWSIVLKGLYEVQSAPEPRAAAEMVLVKLAFVADLPTPDEALRLLGSGTEILPKSSASEPPRPSSSAPRASGATALSLAEAPQRAEAQSAPRPEARAFRGRRGARGRAARCGAQDAARGFRSSRALRAAAHRVSSGRRRARRSRRQPSGRAAKMDRRALELERRAHRRCADLERGTRAQGTGACAPMSRAIRWWPPR